MRSMNTTVAIYLSVVILAVSLDLYARDTQGDLENWQKFETLVNELRKEKSIPGLAIGIVKDAELAWSRSIGYADSNKTIPTTVDTPFWIASVTKTFVGLAFLHLESEGKIDFDEPAAATPGFTGLCRWLASTKIPFAEGLDCDADISIRNILHHQVNAPTGSQFMYNPIMYSRLSRYLEHKFGDGTDFVEGRHNYLGQVIDRTILEPAGMTRTMSSMWDRSKMDIYFDLADGFKVDDQGRKSKLRRPDKHIAGGAGVVSTINDLAKYDIAITKGDVLPENKPSTLLVPAPFKDGKTSPYGFGWYFQCYEGTKLMWHGGWDPDAGYSALHLRIPEHGLSLIALANSEDLWWGNSLTKAEVENSSLAGPFLDLFLAEPNSDSEHKDCINKTHE